MKLKVKYTAQLRAALQRAEEVLELPEATTLARLLQHLAEQHAAGRPHFLSAGGNVNACLLMVVNESAVAASDAAALTLQENDVVLLLPPIAGG